MKLQDKLKHHRHLLVFIVLIFSSAIYAEEKPIYFIYLAGPEVFLPEPVAAGEENKALIEELSEASDWPFELAGLYPLDNEIDDFKTDIDTGLRIYQANIDLMQKADFIAANMIRFRGPSMDVGTAFEMGYMSGLGKPVFAYYEAEPFYNRKEDPGIYNQRVIEFYGLDDDAMVDPNGLNIENFQMSDNLMMIGAMQSGAGNVTESLEKVVLQIATYLINSHESAPQIQATQFGQIENP